MAGNASELLKREAVAVEKLRERGVPGPLGLLVQGKGFHRDRAGNVDIALRETDAADIALVYISGYRSTWKRKDIEEAVLPLAGKFEKICFVYGKDIFYGGCASSADGHTFSTLAELSEHTGVELAESEPYEAAYFGRNRFGTSRFTKPQAVDVVFIKISGYGADYRRSDIEKALMTLVSENKTVYFLYGKEAIYGGYVSQ